jgi:putative MATE family efflux protein
VEDLTQGSLSRHLLKTTSFMLVTMVFQTLYFLVDLYWVGRIGTEAVAAVGIAGNVSFLVLALSQMLGVGATAVISHAVGRREPQEARHLFNQAMALSAFIGVAFVIVGLATNASYSRSMAADPATARQAMRYLGWFIPAMGLQFPLVAMGAALRATGNFKPSMLVSSVTVMINMLLAPFLIFGWATGRPFGVAGAAVASLIAIVIGNVWLGTYFVKPDAYLRFSVRDMRPELGRWKRMLAVGLPTGFEFATMTVYLSVVYTLLRPFGAAAQAGFGIGLRVMQAGFMPVVALGFAVAPVAGQNFGARLRDRVIRTFRDGAVMAAAMMLLWAIVCQVAGHALVEIFANDPAVVAVGDEYLHIISWNFIASGVIFVASSMFQAMGNTMPSLFASAVRIIIIIVPAVTLSRMPGFQMTTIWYLSVAGTLAQLALSLWLLRREFRRKLPRAEEAVMAPQAS